MSFDFNRCPPTHRRIAQRYIGHLARPADLIITTDEGKDYLYRWHVVERNGDANTYFHIQTSSDPERPLHNHPWATMSTLLINAYDELIQEEPPRGEVKLFHRVEGETVFRGAQIAHRLILPACTPYVMTQFVTGKNVQDWGFWIGDNWYSHRETTKNITGKGSVFVYPPGTHRDIQPSHGHY